MAARVVISTDGAVSGRRAACAAVIAVDGRAVLERSRPVADVQGYALAAEIAGVALAAGLARRVPALEAGGIVTVEVDNPSVPTVIDGSYRPPGMDRIPAAALEAARDFCRSHRVVFRVCRRNSTPGLRRADQLASRRLWAHRRRRVAKR